MPSTNPAAAPVSRRGAFPQLLAMEWTKLRSLRSTRWILLLGGLAAVGLTAIGAAQISAGTDSDQMGQTSSSDVVDVASPGPNIVTVLFVIAFGALTITGEHSSGMIRTTLIAAPQRGLLMAAKAATLTVTTWVYGALVTTVCGTVAGLILPSGIDADAGTAMQLIATSATWLTIAALFTFGLGTALRSTAAAVTASFGLIAVLPIVAPLPYTLQDAAIALITSQGDDPPAAYGQSTALVVLCAWAAAALAAGYATLKKRDP